ncbi:MAG: hypothetical protein QOD61_2368 [Solirubrobacteraceae bacterium]|jgi:hypothetical protein|nr:hypothetical protein [Solirubrobacteraceae bacterium]MEA2389878.1 hypothetical protein [Thermoleophilaceae bacterium]
MAIRQPRPGRRRRRIAAAAAGAGAALALAAALGGCSIGSGDPPTETLRVATSHGLSYSLEITRQGSQQCTTASYRTASATGQPILQGSHLCGPPARSGHPVLVQAHSSPESIVVDVPPTGCGGVRAGRTRAALRPLVVRCTTRDPRFRATIIPPASRIVIVGIPGAPVLNFPRHPCRVGLCITPLA